METVVIDTCVLVDIFMKSRPRHEMAMKMRNAIVNRGIEVRIPAFAVFELSHAVRQEKRINGGRLVSESDTGEENGLPIHTLPVDESFIQKYLDVQLPEMRAGDLVFAALAKGEGWPLITEDGPLLEKAISAGVPAFDIRGYLASLGEPAA